jgi:serine/threonine-protein kinase
MTPSGLIKLVDFGLVKVMSPDEEMTITVIQGQGTALYTPLEQYGSDETHTDTRTDIYSYGATLYHLLTNEPPPDARKRFIQPASLIAPRDINPGVSPRTERAVLWAMALHPDDRPASIKVFDDYLFAEGVVTQPGGATSLLDFSRGHLLGTRADSFLLWGVAGLLLVSLLATLLR